MKIVIQDVRIAMPALFNVNKFGNYFARLIFPTEGKAATIVSEAIESIGKEIFSARWPAVKKTLDKNNKLGIHDGSDEEDKRPEYAGQSFVNAKNNVQPKVRDRDAKPVMDEGLIYAGCRVDAHLDVWAGVHTKGGDYVTIQLLGIQFRANDEAFVTGITADDADFKPISDGANAEDVL